MVRRTMWKSLLDYLPRGGTLSEADWHRRHRFLERLLLAHVPGLAAVGLVLDHQLLTVGLVLLVPVAFFILGHVLPGRRPPEIAVTAGLVYCATALVGLTGGATEAHFHFFVIIGFIALYQDWVPFLCDIALTIFSLGAVSTWQSSLVFSNFHGQQHPWLWSLLHGSAIVAACAGMLVFWRATENTQEEKKALVEQLADAEIGRRQFTSDLLLNLARRNQTMLYRQLDIINQLEEAEQDPDVLAELFRLDHLATRVRRNAESLLVLSGEQPPRVWREPVALRDVVRAAIAETEDLERVAFTVDEVTAVSGRCVTDLTHLLAELTENAVRYSPPDSVVTIRTRPTSRRPEGYLLTIEDWGVGMPPEDLAAANVLLTEPPEIDLSVSQRLGFHVVARLAARHGITVSLDSTSGTGTTAVVHLPAALLEQVREPARHAAPEKVADRESATRGRSWAGAGQAPQPSFEPAEREPAALLVDGGPDDRPSWTGWWEVASASGSGVDEQARALVPAQRSVDAPAHPSWQPANGVASPRANGTATNGTAGNGTASNGTASNGTATDSATNATNANSANSANSANNANNGATTNGPESTRANGTAGPGAAGAAAPATWFAPAPTNPTGTPTTEPASSPADGHAPSTRPKPYGSVDNGRRPFGGAGIAERFTGPPSTAGPQEPAARRDPSRTDRPWGIGAGLGDRGQASDRRTDDLQGADGSGVGEPGARGSDGSGSRGESRPVARGDRAPNGAQGGPGSLRVVPPDFGRAVSRPPNGLPGGDRPGTAESRPGAGGPATDGPAVPQQRTATSPPPTTPPTVGGLRRRVPQASLAPELRGAAEHAPTVVPPAQGAAAAGALSRYQAGRRQAQSAPNERDMP